MTPVPSCAYNDTEALKVDEVAYSTCEEKPIMISHQRFEHMLKKQTALSQYSTYEIGGEARYLAEPNTTEDLILLLDQVEKKGMNSFIFGSGSNILFPDQPDPDTLFISMRDHMEAKFHDNKLYVSAGMPMSSLALIGAMNGFHDFDFTFLLPGTFGGGIFMNAKYFSRQMSDVLDTVYYLDLDHISRGVQAIQAEDCEFGYKTTIFQKHRWFVTGADLKLEGTVNDPQLLNTILDQFKSQLYHHSSLGAFSSYYIGHLEQLRSQGRKITAMEDVITDRVGKKHFDYPSCGSVFKNNYDYGVPIGKLADQLNLRGTEYGRAMISPNHGNMIQNRGGAKASDVVHLIQVVQESIDKAFGFVPEPEVVIV